MLDAAHINVRGKSIVGKIMVPIKEDIKLVMDTNIFIMGAKSERECFNYGKTFRTQIK